MGLTTLPPEVLTEILSLLPLRDICICEMTCRFFYEHIKNTLLLEYVKESRLAGVIDNPQSPLSLAQRLHHLRQYQHAWQSLRIAHSVSVVVPSSDPIGSFYELKGGIFFLSALSDPVDDYSRTFVHYLRFDDQSHPTPEWKDIHIDGDMLDIAACVEEHDLVAFLVLESGKSTAAQGHSSINIHFLTMSTLQSHPAANAPVLHILSVPSSLGRPSTKIEIVGNALALLISFPESISSAQDHIYILNWRSGSPSMHISAPSKTYSSFAFIRYDMIVLAHQPDGKLETFYIGTTNHRTNSHRSVPIDVLDHEPSGFLAPQPLATLHLPELTFGCRYDSISCRCEPSPLHPQSRLRPDLPFLNDTSESLFVVQLTVAQNDRDDFAQRFLIVIQVCALLTPSVSSKLTNSYTTLHWETWGPPNSRWFDFQGRTWSGWITAASGARLVKGGQSDVLYVLDFGRDRVHKAIHGVIQKFTRLAEPPDTHEIPYSHYLSSPTLDSTETTSQLEKLMDREELWYNSCVLDAEYKPIDEGTCDRTLVLRKSEIYSYAFMGGYISSQLPYVMTASDYSYEFEAVLMDGSHLLGLDLDDSNDLAFIDILRVS